MFKYLKDKALPVVLFLLINIYLQASWWCWWFGGSCGNRAFIDSYGILALPLAVVIYKAKSLRWAGMPVFIVILFLGWYNTFQIKQYNHGSLHYWWMSKTSYQLAFFKKNARLGYWSAIPVPDYTKARKGVYVSENLITRFEGYQGIKVEPKEIMLAIKSDIKPTVRHQRMAERHAISLDSALTIAAYNRYEKLGQWTNG